MDYQEEVSGQKREIKGITDKVSQVVEKDKEFPLVVVNLLESTPKFKLEALKRILMTGVKGESLDSMDKDVSPVHVALKSSNQFKMVGSVSPKQVRTLVSILTGLSIYLEMEDGRILDRKYILALSSN